MLEFLKFLILNRVIIKRKKCRNYIIKLNKLKIQWRKNWIIIKFNKRTKIIIKWIPIKKWIITTNNKRTTRTNKKIGRMERNWELKK